MRNYKRQVNMEYTDMLVAFAANRLYDIITVQGGLNDFHLIIADKTIQVGRLKPRKFIILYYKYQNCYSNTLWELHTDDPELAKKMAIDYGYYEDQWNENPEDLDYIIV